jgi:hypothetical protein
VDRKAWNSRLRPGKGLKPGKGFKVKGDKKPLRSRTLTERFQDDPTRYGPLWKVVRVLPCVGRMVDPGHECGPGYAPATAHHLGKTDLEGLVPVCGALHDVLHQRHKCREWEERAGVDLAALGGKYVKGAAERLERDGELPEALRGVLVDV